MHAVVFMQMFDRTEMTSHVQMVELEVPLACELLRLSISRASM